MRRGFETLAIAVVLLVVSSRPAHALFGATASAGFGAQLGGDETETMGPTLEVGGYLSVPFVRALVTYATDAKENAGDASQLRGTVRVSPPFAGIYAQAGIGVPLKSEVRDVVGYDVVLGVGKEVLSLGIAELLLGVDYHYQTELPDIIPLEFKLTVEIGL